MNITTISVDLAKNSFSLLGTDKYGKVAMRKTLSRSKLLPFIANGIDKGTVKLASKSKILRTSRHFPIQQAHVTCCHVSNDLLLSIL